MIMTDKSKRVYPESLAVGPDAQLYGSEERGMTLREYYAGLAMQALTTGLQTGVAMGKISIKSEMDELDIVVKSSVELADALLAELEKDKP
jgi:hypothetical protein